MKLLYLYVETWPARCIKKENPIELNFDCGYKFHYNSAANKLSCKFGDELPEAFFSVSSPEACVDSVSVIIGDNGAGKTTIASVMGYLFQRGNHLPEYICIYKQTKKLILYYHFESNRPAPDRSSIVGEWVDAETDPVFADDLRHNLPFDIVYYSPHFSTNEIWPGKMMADELDYAALHLFDISTGHLVQHGITHEEHCDRILAYRSEEQKRILNFAHKYVNATAQEGRPQPSEYYQYGPILPSPIYAQLLVKTTALAKLELSDYYDSSKTDAKKKEWREVLCNTLCANPVWKLVSEMFARVLESEISGEERDVETLKKVLIGICLEAKKLPDHMSDGKWFDNLSHYVSNIDIGCIGNIVEVMKNVFQPMARLYINSMLKRSKEGYILEGQVDISGKEDYDDVIDLRKHMSRLELLFGKTIGMQEPLMDVELANMSSGEMAYWTLFARIDDTLKSMNKKGDVRDLLLFLDEAETTLHPEWQRQLVRNVIWFFEKYASGRHVHIIFATHSPMILSDVPKGNVAFLLKARKHPDGMERQGLVDMHETLRKMTDTFGANIFDLYRHPFFMQEGTVAAFATRKLDELVKKIHEILVAKQSFMISQDEWRVAEMVGDPQVRKYFESIKPLLGAALEKEGSHEET